MRAEYNALVARLRTHPVLANKVDTIVKVDADGSPVRTNYVVAAPAVPFDLDDRRYTAPQRFASARFLSNDVKVVAVDAEGLLLLAEAVQSHLIGHVLTVTGRTCDPIRLSTDELEEGDVKYDAAARLYYVTLTFEFWSKPT